MRPERTIGASTLGYPEARNFARLPFLRYRVVKFQNLHKVPAWLYHRLTGKVHQYYWNSFRDLDLSRCDLFHFFNALSYGRTPWVTTFETSLPRWGPISERVEYHGIELLHNDPCRRIIALSQRAVEIQRKYLIEKAPALEHTIMSKVVVIPPSQRPGIGTFAEKTAPSDRMVFTFVGADFFRKGGREMLKAFDILHQKGIRDWRLNIVSALHIGDYATRATEQDLKDALAIIHKYPDHILHHPQLPNTRVLEIFRNSHVGLLPTWADTYGYSVLESQAYGCPVISTDVRALPEINDDGVGWMLNVPMDDKGNALLRSDAERVKVSQLLLDQLVPCLEKVMGDPQLIAAKGRSALARIRERCDPNDRALRLERIYDEALGDHPE